MRIFLVIFLIIPVLSVPLVKVPLLDLELETYEDFEIEVSMSSFLSDDNSTYSLSVLPNDWISMEFVEPNMISRYDYFRGYDLYVTGDHCYVLDHKGYLTVLDVSDISNPLFLSTIHLGTENGARTDHITGQGDCLYVCEGGKTFILDISVRDSPFITSTIIHTTSGFPFIEGDYLYLAGGYLSVFDVSDKYNPEYLSSIGGMTSANGLVVKGDYAFVSCYSNNGPVGFVVVDVSDKERILIVDYQNAKRAVSVDCDDSELCFVAYHSGVRVFDVTAKWDAALVLDMTELGECSYIVVNGSIAYVLTDEYLTEDLRILDVSNISDVTELGRFDLSTQDAVTLSLVYDTLYIADRYYGLRVLDIRNASEPVLLFPENVTNLLDIFKNIRLEDSPISTQFGSGRYASGIYCERDYIYDVQNNQNSVIFCYVIERPLDIVIGESTFRIFQIGKNNDINFLGEVSLGFPFTTVSRLVVFDHSFAFLAEYDGMTIINVTDKKNPQINCVYTESTVNTDVKISKDGSIAYLTVDGVISTLVKIVDVSNRTHPSLIGEVQLPCVSVNGLVVVEEKGVAFAIYTTSTLDSMFVVNITNSSFPYLVTSNNLLISPTDLSYSDDDSVLYVSASGGVKIVDVSGIVNGDDPDGFEISVLGSVDISYPGVVISGESSMVFVTETSLGVTVIDARTKQFPFVSQRIDSYYAKGFSIISNLVFIADAEQGIKVYSLDLRLEGDESTFDHFCGSTTVDLEVEDCSGTLDFSLSISRDDYCNGRGECLPNRLCTCLDSYEGDQCDEWKCYGYDFTNVGKVCSGNGECVSPDTCKCREWYFRGDKCDENMLYYTVLTPSVSAVTFVFVSLVICLVCVGCMFCCLLACFVFLFLMCSVCGLCGIVVRQTKGLRKFGKLENFDLLLKEQELENDTSIPHLRINSSLFQVNYEDITLIRVLGEGGSSSVVYEVEWNDKNVAFKCFRTAHVCVDQSLFDEFEKEVQILGSISHPNVLPFYGACLNPPRVGILMEFCKNGDLQRFVMIKLKELSEHRTDSKNKNSSFGFGERIRLLHEICLPMSYLHSRRIIHRDLKLENVLLDQNLSCKLMDFGLSKIVDQVKSPYNGYNCP